ncbi:MAG: DUF2520 domain-containing protein [Bacteroidota bacterium]|nr:DUF2520 domain-containing protein [Bacteroidota bacterium]
MKFRQPITIIGAGAVGRSIAAALLRGGAAINGIYSRSSQSALLLAKKIHCKNFGTVDDIKSVQGVIIAAVPDSQIKSVARRLVLIQKSFKNVIVLHTSGALASDELDILKRKGAATGSFHPMQTFPTFKTTTLKNIWCAAEGDLRARKIARDIATTCGASSFEISKEAKVLYHTAGIFASNYLVTLLSIVEEIALKVKITQSDVWKIYRPIIESTLRNGMETSPAEALTGPIARGDADTINKHLQTLSKKKLDHLVPLYSVLGIETARLAKKKKTAGN